MTRRRPSAETFYTRFRTLYVYRVPSRPAAPSLLLEEDGPLRLLVRRLVLRLGARRSPRPPARTSSAAALAGIRRSSRVASAPPRPSPSAPRDEEVEAVDPPRPPPPPPRDDARSSRSSRLARSRSRAARSLAASRACFAWKSVACGERFSLGPRDDEGVASAAAEEETFSESFSSRGERRDDRPEDRRGSAWDEDRRGRS